MGEAYTMMLYSFFITFISPILALWVARKPRGRVRILERFGFWAPLSSHETYVWFHAASVGEVKGIRTIIELYRKEFPAEKVLITVTSTTAIDEALKIADEVRILPFDSLLFYSLAIKNSKISKVIITETEVWPSLLRFLRLKNCNVFWVNARIAQSTAHSIKIFQKIFGSIFSSVKKIITIDSTNASRFQDAGVLKSVIAVLPNSKYDRVPLTIEEARRVVFVKQIREKVITIGNVRIDEAADIFKSLIQFSEYALIFITPRHPESFTTIKEVLETVLENARSKNKLVDFDSYLNNPLDSGFVFVNTFGVLEALYAQSGIAISAGSFLPQYKGHNLLEASPYQTLLMTGSYNESSREVFEVLKKKEALIEIANRDHMSDVISQYLNDPKLFESTIDRYSAYGLSFQGSSKRIFELLKSTF